jgi:hypothetical protein
LFAGSRSSNVPKEDEPPSAPLVLEEIVEAIIASLKVAVTAADGSVFVAVAAGNVVVTVGGVVSTGGVESKTTSTQ